MISQYQQGTVQPKSMTLGMQRQVMQDPRFQYGVPGGQDPRHYQRQAELRRMGVGSAIAKTAMDIGGWEASAGIASAAGMGALGGIAFPMIAGTAALYMPMRGINNAMDRQRFMHGMAADIEQYRETLGFRGGLSYNQATNLAGRMQRSMYQGGFFNKDQQSQIHKIALSNNMISARGGGAASGTLRQYERNFEELKDTTEEVVKLLQTTIEGGMSVIKELQNSGFGSMGRIRQQIRQAKAFGGVTGLGTQNMMQIGAAGARAVQGTPWSANVGASMYQSGAAQAATLSRAGPAGSYAVQRVGGIAAAGGVLANAAMNVLSSGMGTKAVAYAMKPDGTIDEARMNRLMSGKVGAYEMVVGASERGYAMGPSGRVLFERNKEDALNSMSDIGRTQMVNRTFEAWGQGRYGTTDAKAWVFAGQFTNNQRDQRLFAESLLRPKGFDDQYAALQATRATMNQVEMTRAAGPLGRVIGGAIKSTGGYFDRMGEDIVYGSGRVMTGIANVGAAIRKGASYAYEDVLQGIGVYDKYGGINRARAVDAGAAIRAQYGMGRRESELGARGLALTSDSGFARLKNIKKVDAGIDYGALVSKDPKMAAYLYQQIGGAVNLGTAGDLVKNDMVLRGLGATPGSAMFNMIKEQPIAFANSFLATANQYRTSVNKKYENQTTQWDKTMALLPKAYQEKLLDMKRQQSLWIDLGGGQAHHATIGKTKIQGIGTGAAADLVRSQVQVEYDKKNSDIAGTMLHEKSVDLSAYQKAKREAIYYDTFGFKMEAKTSTSEISGITRTTMHETAATTRKKKQLRKILGKEFRFDTAQQQEEAALEIDRLVKSRDISKLNKLAPIISGDKDMTALYFASNEYKEKRSSERQARLNLATAEAIDIRTGEANKFTDHLRYNLHTEVSSKQQSQINKIFLGRANLKDLKSLGKDMISMLATGAGVTEATIKDQIEQGTLSPYLRNVESVQSKEEISAIEKARVDFANAEARKRQADNANKGFIKRDEKEAAAKKANIEYLQAKEEYDKLTGVTGSMSYADSPRSEKSYTSVQPPILNYWNNKWTL